MQPEEIPETFRPLVRRIKELKPGQKMEIYCKVDAMRVTVSSMDELTIPTTNLVPLQEID